MRNTLSNTAACMSLIAFAAGGFAIAQDTPAAAETKGKVADAPAEAPIDPAAAKADSSYALGFRSGGNFAQEFGRYGVTLVTSVARQYDEIPLASWVWEDRMRT